MAFTTDVIGAERMLEQNPGEIDWAVWRYPQGPHRLHLES